MRWPLSSSRQMCLIEGLFGCGQRVTTQLVDDIDGRSSTTIAARPSVSGQRCRVRVDLKAKNMTEFRKNIIDESTT
jgi:hypothetical protein